MPLYDFRCRRCGASFEARTSSDERPECSECGWAATERVISKFAGPFTVAPTGLAARRSNSQRRAREEQRTERRERRRED